MRFIETLRDGDRVQDIYLVKQRTSAVTKNGKPYDSMILQDKTGTIDAKIWEPNSMGIDDCDGLDYVEIGGDVTSFNGALQLNVKRLRKVSEGEYNPADYLPTSDYPIDDMYKELCGYIASMKNPYLKQLCENMLVNDQELVAAFKKHSAAKAVHHGFIGGLLEHSLSVTKNCAYFAERYPLLNRDLLLAAAMLHDVGKTKELSVFPINDYTDEGNLLGHIVMGSEMVSEYVREIPDFPEALKNELKHCILAHHGELEYGSPKKPALMEAMALSFADNLDAKMETYKELLDKPRDTNDEWLGFQRLFDSNVRRTTEN